MRRKEIDMRLKLAEINYKIEREENFIKIETEVLPLVIFEELMWEGFYPILSIILQSQNSEKLVTIAAHSLIKMIMIASCDEKLQIQLNATVNALMTFTGIYKE